MTQVRLEPLACSTAPCRGRRWGEKGSVVWTRSINLETGLGSSPIPGFGHLPSSLWASTWSPVSWVWYQPKDAFVWIELGQLLCMGLASCLVPGGYLRCSCLRWLLLGFPAAPSPPTQCHCSKGHCGLWLHFVSLTLQEGDRGEAEEPFQFLPGRTHTWRYRWDLMWCQPPITLCELPFPPHHILLGFSVSELKWKVQAEVKYRKAPTHGEMRGLSLGWGGVSTC